MRKATHWVMDYETMVNCYVAVFEDFITDERKIFAVCSLRNDFDELVEFLKENQELVERHISYNGLGFDAQITEYILLNAHYWRQLEPQTIALRIKEKANMVIDKSNKREWYDYYERNMSIPQIDVFKLNHWDNAAKRTSLKWIQYMTDWHNLQEMPIHHNTPISTQEELDMIIDYCINDVKSTKKILHLSKSQIALRRTLTNEYNIPLYNASEPKISKELFLLFLSEKTGISKYHLKNSRTKRNSIVVKDIILPYIKFERPEFQELLRKFQGLEIDPEKTKRAFKYSVNYCGVKTDFGLGGVHGARRGGVYKSTEDMTIMTSDVTSFYPNLAIRNGWSPAHIPKEAFCELYEWFFDERKKIPKKDPRNYVYKIVLNSTFGLSIDKHSFLYDPQFGMQITINGQLSLMMLYEMIQERIPGAVPIMQNTDGIETIIPKEHVDLYLEVCKEWEELTMLQLEHDQYQKLILADVNNYIAVNNYTEVNQEKYLELKKGKSHELFKEEGGKFFHAGTKCKGRFVWKDFEEYNVSTLHKNKSNLITAKALYHFFVHDINPERYLCENRNIFDYCIAVRIKGAWYFKALCHDGGEFTEENLQKTIRYYVSDTGCKIMKCHQTDGREARTETGRWAQTIFNLYEEKDWKDYQVNDQYYLQAIYREIENITKAIKDSQLSMFKNE